ncbi:allene oxide synthase-lipoxygenase protein-like isoform X2 [Lineus longissimus]|uniref:allene oxide synthase-lipoxygenase protein-like isoform X2 n=1 Tax=Lineus longissimus TaxID=88925 RepID=UPI002B4F1723
MGNVLSCTGTARAEYVVYVRTGDKKRAGTDANVKFQMHDSDNRSTPPQDLDVLFKDDFERGETDVFPLRNVNKIGPIQAVEFWRDNTGVSPNWFVEKIVVEDRKRHTFYFFPVHRWIKEDRHYIIQRLDTSLPQYDEHSEQRHLELKEMQALYEYEEKFPGAPVQIKELPEDEYFSEDHKEEIWWDLTKQKTKLIIEKKLIELSSSGERWSTLDDLHNLYKKYKDLETPAGIHQWSNDTRFGAQRLCGTNPVLIKLCKKIPENFDVSADSLKLFLEGWSLEQIIEARRLFIVDLKILEGIPHKDNTVLCAPLALFFLTMDKTLRPISIQLFQKSGPDNPVFTPSDPPYTWLIAKMWYNNADAVYHQALTHLGFTHLLMEGVDICTHRHLSPSHPMFKLLAPHFLYLLAINTRGLETLISPDGWVDKTMTVGRQGLLKLIAKGCSEWRMDVNGDFYKELESRGVHNPTVLANYHYRDDASLLHIAISNYVRKIVKLYYGADETATAEEKIVEDTELQAWGAELARDKKAGGAGIKGVPGNGKFRKPEQLIQVFTGIIFTCSVSHAAANFSQYDEYAFQPNYPAFLYGAPPKTKAPKLEEDIIKILPDKAHTLDIMIVTKLLSTRGTNPLGDFEVMYMYDPKALRIVDDFKEELKKVSQTIKQRNQDRQFGYCILDPSKVPNSISI